MSVNKLGRIALLLVFTILSGKSIAQLPIGGWRTHLPYNDVNWITEAGDYIYVVSEIGLYNFHKPTGELKTLSTTEGFSDVVVRLVEYDDQTDQLIIVYKNGNIDILKGNRIINVPEFKQKQIVGIKEVYNLSFDPDLPVAYISTSIGIIELNLESYEFESYLTDGAGMAIYDLEKLGNYFYAAAESGIIRFDRNKPNMKNPADWEMGFYPSKVKHLCVFNQILVSDADSIWKYFANNTWQNLNQGEKRNTTSMKVCNNELIIASSNFGSQTNVGGILTAVDINNVQVRNENVVYHAYKDNRGYIWIGGPGTGLINIDPQGTYGYGAPSGPPSTVSYFGYNVGEEVYMMAGGITTTFAPNGNRLGYYKFVEGQWTTLANDAIMKEASSLVAITANGSGDVWLGSYGDGLIHQKNGQIVMRYTDQNSSLQKQNGQNYVKVNGMAYDSKGNLWVSNGEVDKPLNVRTPDGDWFSYRVSPNQLGPMLVDNYDQKWMIVYDNGSAGLIVAKELSDNIDQTTPINSRFYTNSEGSGNLPSNNVLSMAMDKDGEIWVGTDEGLTLIFSPGNALEDPSLADAQQIIIDDGKDIGYLLGTEVINDIKVDGGNRKWIATNNGVWLVKEDASGVIRHFTTDNSPLLSNKVFTIAIQPTTGEVFFGTENGIISYRGDATEGADTHGDVLVFPNPVRETYTGNITIKGLPVDATVKITDIAGRVVYETIANGGTATWNGIGFNGKRPHTGVYLIFTANKEADDVLVSKLLFVHK